MKHPDVRSPAAPGTLRAAALLAAIGLLTWPGCGTDSSSSEGTASTPKDDGGIAIRGRYESMTEGEPEAMATHIEELGRAYTSTNEKGPLQARAAMRQFTEAVSQTAEAILRREGISADLRNYAGEIWLETLRRRLEAEKTPQNLEAFLDAADSIIAAAPDTKLSTACRVAKVDILAKLPPELVPDREAYFDRVLRFSLELANAEPVFPGTIQYLVPLGPFAERLGRDQEALSVYKVIAEKFPADPAAKAAEGNVRRLELIGKPVGEIAGKDLEGKPVRLEDYRGKVVLIDFWATYCGPCLEEIPALKALRERLGPDNFEIIGVATDTDRRMIAEYVKRTETPWPQIVLVPEEKKEEPSDPLFGVSVDLGGEAKAADTPRAEDEDQAKAEGGEGSTPPEELAAKEEEPFELMFRFGANFLPMKLVIDREGNLAGTGHGLNSVLPDLKTLFPDSEADLSADGLGLPKSLQDDVGAGMPAPGTPAVPPPAG